MTNNDELGTYRVPLIFTAARLSWKVSAGAGYSWRYKPLAPGTIVTHLRDGWGMGSDPGMEQTFRDPQGQQGEILPAGIWGSKPDWLEKLS